MIWTEVGKNMQWKGETLVFSEELKRHSEAVDI